MDHKTHSGADIIRDYASRLPDTPGVYRMLSARGDVLYVGKARSLKKRVLSYTQAHRLPLRLQRMVALTCRMEFVETGTEVEALLLESNYIKKLKPRFNILLRDDKSFPYIFIPQDHDFPQVLKHRGIKTREGHYFGPFAGAVNDTLEILQKIFLLRNCSDTVFSHRTRPCLQYHIKRCTAPCVGLVDRESYAAQVEQARLFLSGESQTVQGQLSARMMAASKAMVFEEAARLRDRLKALASVQGHQNVNLAALKETDVFALAIQGGQACVQVFFFREGYNYGNHPYFPRHAPEETAEAILSAFLVQFYENKPVPVEILLSHAVEEHALLQAALRMRAGRAVRLEVPQRGPKKNMLGFAVQNAQGALARHMAEKTHTAEMRGQVAELFGMSAPPCRIEVYDNSHTSGTLMVGAMIVAGEEGFQKAEYRKFNIRQAVAGDDVGMMREVMQRRFGNNTEQGVWPDLVLIDGGQGQFNACHEVLADRDVLDKICLVAIAKGPDRHAGREWFFQSGQAPFQLPEKQPVLHYLQTLRDEAHRYAIGSHRARRQKHLTDSPLDGLGGIGPKRKRALLLYFGSAKGVAEASVEDLRRVEGVSHAMAQKIHDYFH